MSDPQSTATPSEPSAPPPIPTTSPAQPTPAPPVLRHLETIPGAGWRDGAWMSSSHFAVAGDEGVWAYDVTQPEPRRAPVGTSGDVTALVLVAARRTLVIGDRDGQVHSVGIGSGRSGFHFDAGTAPVTRLTAEAGGRGLAAASDEAVTVADLAAGTEWRLAEQRRAVAWLGDGVFAALGRGGVEVWLCETRGRVASMPADGEVRTLEYLAAPSMLAAGLADGRVAFWAMMDDPPSARGAIREPGGAAALAVAPDGRTLATGSAAGIRVWNDFAPEPPPAMDAGGAVLALRFAPDGQRLAAITTAGIAVFAVGG
jgi:WD40 repeat protein